MIAVSGALIVRHIVEERSPMRGDLQKSSMTTSFWSCFAEDGRLPR
jgi:hypothetical protein